MPKIDITKIKEVSGSFYPPALGETCRGRHWKRLGDAAGLTQFGANLVRVEPGAWSSLRHWHEEEDEFLIMVSGELVLIEDEGESVMRAGDCAGFPMKSGNGHHLVNRSTEDGVFLVVGTRGSEGALPLSRCRPSFRRGRGGRKIHGEIRRGPRRASGKALAAGKLTRFISNHRGIHEPHQFPLRNR